MKSLILLLALFFNMQYTHAENSHEKLLGVSVDREGITYQVNSGGCTVKEDFEVLQLETYPVKIILKRNNEDYCEAFLPNGTKVKFSFEELGIKAGTNFELSNPLGTQSY